MRTLIWGGAALILLTLWSVMRLTGQGNWTAFDFVVAALLLASVCTGLELAMRLSATWTYRLAAIMTVGGGFLMVWANLAVGIIGNEGNPQNLIFYSVLLIGLAGAIYTRFDPKGLKWTLRMMAAAQLAVFFFSQRLSAGPCCRSLPSSTLRCGSSPVSYSVNQRLRLMGALGRIDLAGRVHSR